MSKEPRSRNHDNDNDVNWQDTFDDVVVNADDTGMVATERFITDAEIEEGLEGTDKPRPKKGDV